MTESAHLRLTYAIGKWIKGIDDQPGWREWQRKKIRIVLDAAEGLPRPFDLDEFQFPEPLEEQHAAIMSFLTLRNSFEALTQCEYYFRRFPFRGLPVSKEHHLRNICEMYFNRFYEFRERMKRCLNAVNGSIDQSLQLEVGPVLRLFDKVFDLEIRQRNRVHHHEPFDDLAFDSISLATMLADSDRIGPGWKVVANKSYRHAAHEWAERVKRRSMRVAEYLDGVAEAMLQTCTYLQQQVNDSDLSHMEDSLLEEHEEGAG